MVNFDCSVFAARRREALGIFYSPSQRDCYILLFLFSNYLFESKGTRKNQLTEGTKTIFKNQRNSCMFVVLNDLQFHYFFLKFIVCSITGVFFVELPHRVTFQLNFRSSSRYRTEIFRFSGYLQKRRLGLWRSLLDYHLNQSLLNTICILTDLLRNLCVQKKVMLCLLDFGQ